MTLAALRSFTAKYDGVCGTCPAPIAVGDAVFYPHPGAEAVSGVDCCGDRPAEDLVAHARGDDSLSVDEEDASAVIARTLPRGKTAASKCPTCWQIPANNGSCGCDY